MKDSGIEWIGKIPEDWEVIKFKYILEIIGGNGFAELLQGNTSGKYPFCKVSDINSKDVYVDKANNYVSEEIVKEYKFNIIPSNSILIAKIGEALKKNHRKINTVDCIIDNNMQAFISNENIKYCYYLLSSIDMTWFDNNGTVPSINNFKLKNFGVPKISYIKQQKIANFLDQKVSEIDHILKKTRESIQEYKKYKQSIIIEAITKGLNPNVKMKNSGIEWIGEIPEHWNVSKVKYELRCLDYLREPISAEKRINILSLYDYYGASGIIDKIDDYNVDDTVLLIGEDGANLLMRNLPLVYKASGRFWVNNHAHILKPYYNNDYDYLAYLLEAGDYTLYITGSAQPKLSQSKLMSFPIIRVPIEEQKIITKHLNKKVSDIDSLIAQKETLLKDLELYKKSLIYECVTGKREVM